MILSNASEIAFQLDGHTTDEYLYLRHDNVFILLWKSSMEPSLLEDQRNQMWYEKNIPFFVCLFATAFFLLLLLSNVRLSRIAGRCSDEVCDAFSDEHLYPKNVKVGEILSIVA